MPLKKLAAYDTRGCDSGEVFRGLKIESVRTFWEYLNPYDVIYLNMQHFLNRAREQKLTKYLE